ncbi:MAG: hypothetical protein WCL06_03505 [Bacteroidota bacterium]
MIKNFLIFCTALFLFTSLSAQDIYKPDKRLYDCFSSDDIVKMENSRSELIPYYNYYLEHSYYMVDLKKARKVVDGKDIHTVTARVSGTETPAKFDMAVYSKETFNPLKYNFNLQKDSYVVYVWKEAGVAIVFYPLSFISNAYKELTKKRNN